MGEIVGARVKTDKEDIKRLLKLLFGGIVPEVWVPPAHVRELRAFISYRNRLVATGTMVRNRLQSLLHKHNLLLPEEGILNQAWWDAQASISALEKLQIRQELSLLDEIEKNRAAVDEELEKQSTGQVLRVQPYGGIGPAPADGTAAVAHNGVVEHVVRVPKPDGTPVVKVRGTRGSVPVGVAPVRVVPSTGEHYLLR